MVIRWVVVCTVVLAVLAGTAGAQSDAPVARPELKPGDTWTYRRIDLWTNRPTATLETVVTFANEKVIQTTVRIAGQGLGTEGESDSTQTAEWNQVSSSTGMVFYPHNGLFKFPMGPGSAWDAKYEAKNPRQGAFQVASDRKVRVVGWEEVEVPAGKFRALRIESTGNFQRIDMGVSGTTKDVLWYAPEVKRFVKWTYEDATFRGRFNWWAFEMTAFKLN
jgi:hypothetical protein